MAPLARDHRLIITHGNGPQVGLLALEAAAYTGIEPYTSDVLSAESEGMIGYMICRGPRGHRHFDRVRGYPVLALTVREARVVWMIQKRTTAAALDGRIVK